ncbi:cullin-1-like protein [Trifolium pratense]|uniref:Cullin-1-like protein n=1 Tax=Trifolium pratense TaxID=57577 RepID=A0A2K3M356_TRIPR|nr:cullin-1-like protein [Trifolium pratense]
MSARKIISFEEGWEILKTGIAKLQNIVEELEPNFTSEEHMKLYTEFCFSLARAMCGYDDAQELCFSRFLDDVLL